MSDEQETKDRHLRSSRALVVSVHLAIIVMSVAIVYFEIINVVNVSKLDLSKGWWAASIISIICQVVTIGCVIFAIVSIFLDFETLSAWFVIIPIIGISIALIASSIMAIPTLSGNFPNNYANKLFNQYTNNDQFWSNLKGFEKSYSCCGINGVGDYQNIGRHIRAEGYCARRLKLIKFDALEEGFLRSIKWDYDMVFNTSNYYKDITRQGFAGTMEDAGKYSERDNNRCKRECQATAFKFKEKLEDWSKKLQPLLEARMGQGINNFTITSSCGQVMGQLMADSRRLFMYTAVVWLLITLACLGAFLYGRLKHAVINKQVIQQVIQPQQAPVYAPPVFTPPTPVQPYMIPPRFNSIDGFDMFSNHQPSYYRHPSQNVSYYNPYANYPRDPTVRPQATVIQQRPPSPLPNAFAKAAK